MWDLSIHRSFLLIPSTCCKFILTLKLCSWVSAACVCYCGFGKLWLLVILWKILLVMLNWYPFPLSTCFILVLYLLSHIYWWSWSMLHLTGNNTFLAGFLVVRAVVYGQSASQYKHLLLYPSTKICPLFSFSELSRNASSPLLSSFIVNLIFSWRLLMWWKTFSKCVCLRME